MRRLEVNETDVDGVHQVVDMFLAGANNEEGCGLGG